MIESKIENTGFDLDSLAGKIVVGIATGFAILTIYALGKSSYERSFSQSDAAIQDQKCSLSLRAYNPNN